MPIEEILLYVKRTDRLDEYEKIAAGNRRPRYLDTKMRKCDFDSEDQDKKLWSLHDSLMKSENTSGSSNLLALKTELADRMLLSCELCERRCKVDRKKGEKGRCGVIESRISSDFIHMGEEPEVVPSYTIFFSGCTFKCVFCQNWDISTQPESGRKISPENLSKMIEDRDPFSGRESNRLRMIRATSFLDRPTYAKNVNWVGGDPTSNLPFILKTLSTCNAKLPQIWNSNMYLTVKAMNLLDGVIDLYLTDFKYGNNRCAKRLSGIDDYFDVVSRNHMIGSKQCDMLVRHLVMPNHLDCCTKPVLELIAAEIPDAVVNVMSQYRPEHNAFQFEDISRPISTKEYNAALKIAEGLRLKLTS